MRGVLSSHTTQNVIAIVAWLSSTQPVNIECSLHYSHIWKLVGFVYPLHGFNYPIRLPTSILVGRTYIVASHLASLDSTIQWLYLWELNCALRSDSLFVITLCSLTVVLMLKNLLQAGLSTWIQFGASFHFMNCTMKMPLFCKYWTLVCRLDFDIM